MTNSPDTPVGEAPEAEQLETAEATDALDGAIGEVSEADKSQVRRELERIRGFVGELTMDDLKGGDWFAKLCFLALDGYSSQVNADYFRKRYPNLPPDAIVQARIDMAARYAGIEGAMSASAYTGAVAATIGTGGGASPLTLPAGVASFVVDMSYTSYLQLRLAHDIAVLYGVPLDKSDPDDMWKLIRLAFAIRSSQAGGELVLKGVPALVRPLVKKVFSGGVLAAAKNLPVVGRYLLQRNMIKFAIPGVGIPLTVAMNYWTTRVVGRQARTLLRTEARIIEHARRLTERTSDHDALVWVMWLVMQADKKTTENELLLLQHVQSGIVSGGDTAPALEELRTVIDIDEERVYLLLDEVEGDREPIYRAAVAAACVDGVISAAEHEYLQRLAHLCRVEYRAKELQAAAKAWK